MHLYNLTLSRPSGIQVRRLACGAADSSGARCSLRAPRLMPTPVVCCVNPSSVCACFRRRLFLGHTRQHAVCDLWQLQRAQGAGGGRVARARAGAHPASRQRPPAGARAQPAARAQALSAHGCARGTGRAWAAAAAAHMRPPPAAGLPDAARWAQRTCLCPACLAHARARAPSRPQVVLSTDVFGCIRSLAAFRLTGAQRDYVIVGSDSGRIVILDYNRDKNTFVKVRARVRAVCQQHPRHTHTSGSCTVRSRVWRPTPVPVTDHAHTPTAPPPHTQVHQETFGRSGCRRIVPGQYVAADPKGRACIIGERSFGQRAWVQAAALPPAGRCRARHGGGVAAGSQLAGCVCTELPPPPALVWPPHHHHPHTHPPTHTHTHTAARRRGEAEVCVRAQPRRVGQPDHLVAARGAQVAHDRVPPDRAGLRF
jgi:hypothetical protein